MAVGSDELRTTAAPAAVIVWPDGDLSAFWLPLLLDLTERFPSWGVWKNADRAFSGIGDLDSIAPSEDWEQIQERHNGWAFSMGATAVVPCDHAPEVLSLFSVFPTSDLLAQFDAVAACSWRGSRLFRAEQVASLYLMDPRGFRALRPGAAALSIFLMNGVKRAGRLNDVALREKRVYEQMNEDPEGVLNAADIFRIPIGADRLTTLLRGEPGRAMLLVLESRAAVRSLAHPTLPLSKARLRMFDKGRCPVQVALRRGRRFTGDLEGWLASVRTFHPVFRPTGSSATG